jgi:hypothetical protein
MNERIEDLARQCMSMRFFVDTASEEFDYKKFAELIVLECANAVMDGTKEGDHYAMRIEHHFDNGQGGILHFGVDQ